MTHNKYIIKSLAPWMIDELIAFSKITDFEIIFLRKQDEFYKEEIEQLRINGINVYVQPYSFRKLAKKLRIVVKFILSNILKFRLDYNFVIGFKTIIWFIRLDITKFSPSSNIHAQFATQAALVSFLIKQYYKNSPQYSFTFHAHDIYFANAWFNLLVNNSRKAFSISNYNIDYVKNKFLDSDKITLSRLGVFREELQINHNKKKESSQKLELGLISWFVEKKGIAYLLKAMLELKNLNYDHITLTLAGDGPLKNEFIEFIKKNDLADTINYIGKIKGEQKQHFFNSIDVFVLPSISLDKDKDGIPVVLMEALASSLPLISTKVSGIPEICKNDYNGLLVEQRNFDELVKAIIFLYNNKTKRQQYSNNSFLLSKEYDIITNSKHKVKTIGWE